MITSRFNVRTFVFRSISWLLLGIFLCTTYAVPTVGALSPEQRRLIDANVRYYDIEESTYSCEESSSTVTGGDNPEIIWNYFIKQGLKPIHVAGIMGNFQAESGLNPRRVQSTSTPEGDADYPTDGVGFGLAQWTFSSRQQPLVDLAESRGKVPGDLIIQLDYVMQEFNGGYQGVYRDLLASETVEEATNIILERYEIPADIPGQRPVRQGFARDWLAQFGDDSTGGSTPQTGSYSSCGEAEKASACVGSTSLPLTPDVQIQWYNSTNHGTSVSYPDVTSSNNAILRNQNAFGAQSLTSSTSNVGEAADVGAPAGTKVFAPTDGKVLFAGPIPGSETDGHMVVIESSDKRCVSLLAHLSAPNVGTGNNVRPGQQIGTLYSGIARPHLQFELWVDGQPVNIGKDTNPCTIDQSGCDDFSDEAQQIWQKQNEALTGGTAIGE